MGRAAVQFMRCVFAKGIYQTVLLKLAAARIRKEIKPLDLTIPGVKLQWQGRLNWENTFCLIISECLQAFY